ncbi:MAG TPA: SIMPL domain-containing protein [Kofleriaceae bacterium]|jgi:uncharacterized protein YggE
MTKTLAALPFLALAACTPHAPQIITIPGSSPALDALKPGGMTVQGQATLEVSPDCADMTITLAAAQLKPGTAARDLEKKRLELVASLQKAGVEIKDVKVSNLELEPEYVITDKGIQTRQLLDYRASIVITATTRDFVRIPEMLDAAASAGSSQISTQFRRSDLAEMKKKVRDMALTAAKDKAEQTAKSLGIKLGRITSVAENAGGYMWSQEYFPSNSMAVQNQSGGAEIGGSLQPLTLNVSIAYELAAS